jgi:hypothetical protein
VGNLEEARTITVRMDKTPPQTTIDVGSPKFLSAKDALYVTDKSVFTLDSHDSESGMAKTEYRIDGGPWTAYSPFNLRGEGKHVIEYRGTDKVGNQEIPHSLHVMVETASPFTAVYMGKKRYEAGSTIYAGGKNSFTLSATNNLWGWKNAEYRIDNGPWTTYATPFAIAGEGSHLVEYRSVDSAGNQEVVRSFTAVVDNTPPVSTINIAMPKREADGVVYINSSTILVPTATDNISGVAKTEYRLAGKGVESDPLPFSIATEGKYLIEYWSTDKAGNQEAPRALTVVVNNSLPVIPPPPVAKSEAAAPTPLASDASSTPPATTGGDNKPIEQKVADNAPQKPAEPVDAAKTDLESVASGTTARPIDTGSAAFGAADPVSPSEAKEESKFFEYLTLGIVQLALIVGIMLF